MGNRKKIGLISGGIDSTLMAAHYDLDRLVYFNTESGYNEGEINSMTANKFVFDIIDTPELTQQKGSAFSPLRNLILISLAINWYDADEVWLAGVADDVCPDKNKEIFSWYSFVLSSSLGREITVHSPFWGLTKGQLVEKYRESTWLLKNTFSCYEPVMDDGSQAECKRCKACFRKWVALVSNGIECRFENETIINDYLARLHTYDLDRQSRILRALMTKHEVLALDLDGVLCELNSDPYAIKKPIRENIIKANSFRDAKKIIYTARFESDRAATKFWLEKEHVVYHGLIMNKMPYHHIFDDLAKDL